LAKQALIVVDDSNWIEVKQANWDFIAANPECRIELGKSVSNAKSDRASNRGVSDCANA